MTLAAMGGTGLIPIGSAQRELRPNLAAMTTTTIDAANEACIQIGQIYWTDHGSHTVDTSGSSSIGWRTGTTTFANVGTSVNVGLATVDTAAGPAGRATNVVDVITFSVSKTMLGNGGGITSAAWQEHVPDTGTITLAHGDLVAMCVQATARAGADSVVVNTVTTVANNTRPSVTGFVAAAYTVATSLPNTVITASDGTLGFFFGCGVMNGAATTQTWNGGGGQEFGNFLQMPVPARIYGLYGNLSAGGDCDMVLYTDPLGTPAAAKTVSIDANTVGVAAATGVMFALFSSPYDATANQPLAAIFKPGGTNVSSLYKSMNSSAHQAGESLGTNGYAVGRTSGAFAAVNSSKDRWGIGLLIGGFDDGTGAGSTGLPRSRLQLGH